MWFPSLVGLVWTRWFPPRILAGRMGRVRFTLRELRQGIKVPLDERTTIVVCPDSAVATLLGRTFESGKSFPLPRALSALSEVFGFALTLRPKHALVVGHTEAAAGGVENEVSLSGERAAIAAAWLEGNVDPWLGSYGGGVPAAKRWSSREDHLMLRAISDLPDAAQGGSRTNIPLASTVQRDPLVERYQTLRGLDVDGIAGPITRTSLIKDYFALSRSAALKGQPTPAEKTSEPVKLDMQFTHHGAGGNFSIADVDQAIADAGGGSGSRQDSSTPKAASDARLDFLFFCAEGPNPAPAEPGGPEFLELIGDATLRRVFLSAPADLATSNQLFMELFDKSGVVAHANRAYKLTGPESLAGVTDSRGRLAHDDVAPGDYTLDLSLEFFDAPDTIVDVHRSPVVVLGADQDTPQVRMIGVVPRVVLARLGGLLFDTNKAFIRRDAVQKLKQVRAVYEQNDGTDLLVVGHTDTVGDASINDPLSVERADATLAYLLDDVETWLEFYGSRVPESRRWGADEDFQMLDAINAAAPQSSDDTADGDTDTELGNEREGSGTARDSGASSDSGSEPNTPEDRMREFQRSRGLPETSIADKDTRRQLIREYMRLDGVELDSGEFDISADTHGCGENFPLDDTGKELDLNPENSKEDQLDRRVELFFFDREFGVAPKPRGKNSPKGSTQYPSWRERAKVVFDSEVPDGGEVDSGLDEVVRFLDADDAPLSETFPGSVLIANLDIHDRDLPEEVSSVDGELTKDVDRAVASDDDPDLFRFQVRAPNVAAVAGRELFLKYVGFPETVMHFRTSLNDSEGKVVRNPLGVPNERVLGVVPDSGRIDLTIEGRTIPGSPLGRISSDELLFTPDDVDESFFELELLSRTSGGIETVHDRAKFNVAPIVFVDRGTPAKRIYICDVPGFNDPSVEEIEDVVKGLSGVKLVKVPIEVNNGDAWLQDQYQTTITQRADGVFRQVVLHLPRLRQNMLNDSSLSNLREFVDTHFPSKEAGVCAELWKRELVKRDASGTARRIEFVDTFETFARMRAVFSATRLINAYGRYADRPGTHAPGTQWQETIPDNWTENVRGLEPLLEKFKERVEEELDAAGGKRGTKLQQQLDHANTMVEKLTGLFPVEEGSVGVPVDGTPVQFTDEVADQLYSRFEQLHSSGNYGGNLESTPPTERDPLGTIILGNKIDAQFGEFVDPDVKRVLQKQHKQRIVEVDTTWLRVGHVDEMLAVVPNPTLGGTAFGMFHASPITALQLIRVAEERYRLGLPPDHPHSRVFEDTVDGVVEAPSDSVSEGDRVILMETPDPREKRETVDGTTPVTRLMRGRTWLHKHTEPGTDGSSTLIRPPFMYSNLVRAYDEGLVGALNHGIGSVPGPGADRFYFADISIRELLYADRDRGLLSSNTFINGRFIEPELQILRVQFPEAPLLPIPVLFDAVFDTKLWDSDPNQYRTIAFAPDMVNMQVLDTDLLIPRPYGPRMRTDDAIDVVKTVMGRLEVSDDIAGTVDTAMVSRNKLNQATYFVESSPTAFLQGPSGAVLDSYGGIRNQDDIIERFNDSFPGASESELRAKLITPNSSNFDGNQLKDGFQRFTFNDGMVDLFELYTVAMVESLGLKAHFVDSWYYHLHDGGIHCGTNVLLEPPVRGGRFPDLVTAPDVGR